MPIYFHEKNDHYQLALWYMTEPTAYFESLLREHYPAGFPSFLTAARYRQWLVSRYLLLQLAGPSPIAHTPNGKPFFVHRQQQLSISHSGRMVAVMLAPQRIALDIEQPNSRMLKIKDSFLSAQENPGKDIQQLALWWSAKETIIKLSDGMTIDYMKRIHISEEKKGLLGRIVTNGKEQLFPLQYRSFQLPDEQYVMVYAA